MSLRQHVLYRNATLLFKVSSTSPVMESQSIAANKRWNSVLIRSIHRESAYARNCPPAIEASHFQIMSANLTMYHPNISSHV